MTSTPHHTTASLTDPNRYRSFDNINMAVAELKGPTTASPWLDTDAEPETPSESSRRKRLSFFGRTSSDAATRKQLPLQPLPATTPVPKRDVAHVAAPTESHSRRPTTAGSEHGRKKTSDQIVSIRQSIFGGKKATATSRPTPKRPRHSHQIEAQKATVGSVPLVAAVHVDVSQLEVKGNAGAQSFRYESDFYHHRKKTSISSPFNFHHVGHTGRKNLPTRLETVDEKALADKFHDDDVQGHLVQGVSTEHVRHSRLGVPDPLPALLNVIPSHHRNSPSVDETVFDETSETKFNVDEHFNERPALRSPERSRRHSSPSSPTLPSPPARSASHTTPHLHVKASFEHTLPSVPHERTTRPARGTSVGHGFRPNQSLTPVSPQDPAAAVDNTTFKASPVSNRQSVGPFSAPPGMKSGYPASVASQMSKRSSKSAAPTTHSISTRAFSDIPAGVDWEDDIDFAFEQEAEATCDFDWEKYTPGLKEEPPIPSPNDERPDSSGGGGVRLSDWYDESSAVGSENTLRSSNSTTSISPIHDDDQPLSHKRGSSVGHRGFLAARNASTDRITKTPPPQLEIKDSESPYAVQTYYSAFDTVLSEYLSDPESTRPGGRRHRKSSSFGSFESFGRSLQTTSASDSTRWSSASTSSIPDLLHSHHSSSRKRSSIRKSVTCASSRTLESVPHSPDGMDRNKLLAGPEERPTVDRSTSDGILMRRPATSEDRTLLFQSGRVVQRGRLSLSSRTAIRCLPADEQEEGWI